ncbi:MAG: amino acid ABC transporter permease [Oscillospiraceae bacterium]|jgi:L-cystine transport system permease protein|nr:amino acid ABC transporter permease [Oscillospiraceae bacterium]
MQKLDWSLIFTSIPKLLSRIHITFLIVIVATVCGIIIGLVMALFRVYKVPVLRQIAVVYASFIRGTPIIVQLFLIYYGLPVFFNWIFGVDIGRLNKMYFILVTYSLSMGAFFSEIMRSTIEGVGTGQSEAAYSIGMTKLQTFRRIVLPQAALAAVPSLSTSFVSLLQNTSLGYTIGIIDVIGRARTIINISKHTIEPYTAAAIIFVFLSIVFQYVFSFLEKRLSKGRGAVA